MVRYCRKAISLLLLSREPGSASPALTILSQCYNPPCRQNIAGDSPRCPPASLIAPASSGMPYPVPASGSRPRLFFPISLQPRSSFFAGCSASEQAHAFQVLERLKAAGQTDPDLLTAALLHDVGKVLFPLSLLDRVVIVLGKRLLPRGRPGAGARERRTGSAAHSWWLPIIPNGAQTWQSRQALPPGRWNLIRCHQETSIAR